MAGLLGMLPRALEDILRWEEVARDCWRRLSLKATQDKVLALQSHLVRGGRQIWEARCDAMDQWLAPWAKSEDAAAAYAERYVAARASARHQDITRRARVQDGTRARAGASLVPSPVGPVTRRSGRAVRPSSWLHAGVFVLGDVALDAAVDVCTASDRHQSSAARLRVRAVRY